MWLFDNYNFFFIIAMKLLDYFKYILKILIKKNKKINKYKFNDQILLTKNHIVDNNVFPISLVHLAASRGKLSECSII